MKPKSMGEWNPDRLVLSRHRRGLTQGELAKAIGVARETIARLEAGDLVPSEVVVRRLGLALGFPLSFFQGQVELLAASQHGHRRETRHAVSFRALRSLKSRDRLRALAAGTMAIEISDVVDARFVSPEPAFPDLSAERPALAARALRKEWHLGSGPLGNLVHLAESRGARVFWLAHEAREVDAFCFWHENRPMVMLNPDKSGERGRFDLAHEIGHLVLHQHGEMSGRRAEEEANAFAAAFLIDADEYSNDCPRSAEPDDYLEVKRKWRVSIASLVRAAHDIGHISDWQYRSAYVAMASRGWRTDEPEPVAREQSLLYEKVRALLARRGGSLSGLAKELSFPEHEFLELLPLLNLAAPADQRPSERALGEPSRVEGPQLRLVWNAG